MARDAYIWESEIIILANIRSYKMQKYNGSTYCSITDHIM
jgi:hypothetical protein